MADIRQQQSKNFNRLLDEVGKSQKEIAAIVGVSETTLSHWMNGQVHISRKNAQKVHDAFPAYSVEFLLGETTQPNDDNLIKETALQFMTETKCIETLLYFCRVDKDSITYHHGESPIKTVSVVWDDGQDYEATVFDDFVQFVYKGKVLKLTIPQWRAFKKEIKDYIRLRLNSMRERGCW